jgi:hypothetical protein
VAYTECSGGTYIHSSVFCTSIGLAERSPAASVGSTIGCIHARKKVHLAVHQRGRAAHARQALPSAPRRRITTSAAIA